jgi:hypothetical protein
MADNIAVTAGSGTTLATDDIGGTHYQRVKLSLGADGTANDASAGAGAVGTGTQRVTLASDDPAVVALQVLDNAISGSEMQVDVVAALPAGTNNIGDVDILSIAAGDNNIGNVDIVTVPSDPFGANADAASATGSISAKLSAIATALGVTAFDLGSGTGGSRTLRWFQDTAQWIGGSGAITSATQRVALATDSPGVIGVGTAGSAAANVVTVQGIASMTPVQAETAIQYIDVALSLDTSAYASGDLLADAQIVAACTRANDVEAVLQSIMVIDEDDQKAAFTIYFASASASWGTENSAPSISDANAREILGYVDVAVADYKDLGGVSVACKNNVGMVVKPASGSDDIYVAVVNGSGTPTYTASGVRLRLGFI